jgi:hypothetical protein
VTADQREQALAAFERIDDHTSHDDGYAEEQMTADLALVRAALTPPPLPADLAEIRARAVVATRATTMFDKSSHARRWRAEESAADVPALVAELSELRARPTLTAEEAREAAWAMRPFWSEEYPILAKLRAIAEGAGS